MAGHSKYANTKHRKAAQDSKRNKIFTKVVREIYVAQKAGGGPRLELALKKARFVNLPKDKIEAAIKKASGENSHESYEEVRYEGYGLFGVAIIVETLTDNRNRTASEVRSAFTKYNGALGETGSLSFLFDRIGVVEFLSNASEESVLEFIIECGADNLETNEEDGTFIVECKPEMLHKIKNALEEKFGECEKFYLDWKAKSYTQLDQEKSESILKLVDALEESDDVQNVVGNFILSEEV